MSARKALGVGLVAFGAFLVVRASLNSGPNNTTADALTVQANLLGATLMQTPAVNMSLSAAGLQAIANREGFSPYSYPDASGRSIGYGHYIQPGENFTEPMTPAMALSLLQSDASIATDAVRAYVKVPLSQNQFDALVSFVYNVGAGNFKRSTLLAKLNAGDYTGAAAQFDAWHIPSIVIARRNDEKAQFLG